MIILKPISTEQTFKIIPTRGAEVSTLVLRNETTNVETTYVCPSTASSFYLSCTQFLTNLKEGHFYEATFYFFGTLVHRERVFCTNQTIEDYTINKDEYIASTNNIIFYE